jgi:CHAT domain-containing protein
LPDDPPRITWCLSGPLAFLPLHAAGCYGTGEETRSNKAYHYIVSSYTPSLSALIPRSQGLKHSDNFIGFVGVSQSTTSGYNDLPGTVDEINAIKTHFKDIQFRHFDGPSATTKAVLQSMETSSWIHLACHGIQHRNEPTKSAFMLYDGPLELSTISQRSLLHARFAFLSACQTATGDENLPEESVHLAAGMIVAGYHSVIGTMWSIRDKDGPVVADGVYRYLTPKMQTDDGQVAYALHKAMKALRQRNGETDFLSWIPFIHFGI